MRAHMKLRWTNQRKAFGKPLNSQAVIRSKLASMIARTESVQNWLENITHQMNNMVRQKPRSTLLNADPGHLSPTRSRLRTLQDLLVS